jgi:hypothetical protein
MNSLAQDLRHSLEVGSLALALAQAHAALESRPMPQTFSELHPFAKRRYQEAALLALYSVHLDAERYAETEAGKAAHEEVDEFCRQHGVDWRDLEHPINDGDHLEMLVYRIARKAISRYKQVLSGIYPGLSAYLHRLELTRTTDTDPALAQEQTR